MHFQMTAKGRKGNFAEGQFFLSRDSTVLRGSIESLPRVEIRKHLRSQSNQIKKACLALQVDLRRNLGDPVLILRSLPTTKDLFSCWNRLERLQCGLLYCRFCLKYWNVFISQLRFRSDYMAIFELNMLELCLIPFTVAADSSIDWQLQFS